MKLTFPVEIGTIIFALLAGSVILTIVHAQPQEPMGKIQTPTVVPPQPTQIPTSTPPPYNGFCLRVPILMYHHVQPMDQARKNRQVSLTVDTTFFDNHMKYLSEHGYHTLSVESLVTALIQKTSLPPKSIVVTIDDGYNDIFSYAFPILKKYNIVANLMIPTGLLNNPGYLTWGWLKEMVSTGKVFAYNHTWSHYSLTKGNEGKQEDEIRTAKKQLEENLGIRDTILAYPYGSFNNVTISLLKKLGFRGALSTIPGFVQCDSFLFSLHRQRAGNNSLATYSL